MNFPNLAKIWIGPRLVVFLYDPRDVEIILSSQVYIDKSPEYEFFKPWLGDGLLISTGTYDSRMLIAFFTCIHAFAKSADCVMQ